MPGRGAMNPALRRIRPRTVSFVHHFAENGGRAAAAAVAAGYARGGARAMAHRMLRDDCVLALLAAEINRRGPAANEARRRLLLPSRPEELRVRFEQLLAAGVPARLVGTAERPAVVLVLNPTQGAETRARARRLNPKDIETPK